MQNLFSVISILCLSYLICFKDNFLIISHETNVFGHGFISNDFMVLDAVNSSFNGNDSYSFTFVENYQ